MTPTPPPAPPGADAPPPDHAVTAPALTHTSPAQRYGRYAAAVGVMVIAALGFVMSWDAVSTYARPSFRAMAPAIPLMLDLTVAVASLWYVLGALADGKRRAGWRILAHAAVAGTLAMNALAGLEGERRYLPLYLIGPAIWSAVVELVAKEALKEWQAVVRPERIDRVLWLVAPWESAAAWLRAARTRSLTVARRDAGRQAAALELVHLAIPGRSRSARAARHVLRRQIRSGALAPAAVVAELGARPPEGVDDPQALQWRVLVSVLRPPVLLADDRAAATVQVCVIDRPADPIDSHPITSPQPIRSAVEPTPAIGSVDRIARSDRPVPPADPIVPPSVPAGSDPTAADPIETATAARTRSDPPVDPITDPITDRVTDPVTDPVGGAEPLRAIAAARPAVEAARVGRQTRAAARPVTARQADVARLREAITTGALDGRPSVDAVRRHLQISPNYARAARAAVLADTTAHRQPTPGGSRLVSHSVTPQDLRSIPTANGTSKHDNQEEAEEEFQK